MDLTRLCVRFQQKGATACQTPHLAADILTALRKKGYDVRVVSMGAHTMTFVVDGQEVLVRVQSSDATDDHWYSVTVDAKAVCLSPLRTETVPTYVKDATQMYPVHEVLYKMWANGNFPATEEELLAGVTTLTGIRPIACVSYPVTYVEVSTFVDAIRLIIEATSEA